MPAPAPVSPAWAATPAPAPVWPAWAATPARAGALGMPTAPTSPARPVQIPAQRPIAGPEPAFSGRRTPPAYGDPLAALAEAATVVTTPVVIDPTPRTSARPKRGAALTVLVVLMVLVAIGGGIALAVIGASMQS
jgi:hypothetical protein